MAAARIRDDQTRTRSRGKRSASVVPSGVRKKEGAIRANATTPVFATADSMSYSDVSRTLHYETNVDIRQGNDRLTSSVADVYLYKDKSEVEKTVAQRNVDRLLDASRNH